MIKVIIVDDEYLIRIGIKSTIQWEENGFLIVGDAANGEEAIKLYHETLPDIVITDIKMPKMDGLELTKRIKAINPEVKIVILSSHNDFIYAKEAITLEASDYILKATMEPNEILNTLLGVKKQIENRNRDTRIMESLRSDLEQHKDRIKKSVFGEFIRGKLDSSQNNPEYLEEVKAQFPYRNFIIVCGRIDDFEEYYRRENPLTKRLIRESILNIFDSKMNDAYRGMVEEYSDGIFVVVLSVHTIKYSCEDAGLIYSTAVQEAVKAYTRVTISMSISKGISDFNAILPEVMETLGLLRYKIYLGRNCIMPFKQKDQYNIEINRAVSCEEDKLRYYVLNGQYEEAREIITEIFEHIGKKSSSFQQLNYVCTQFVSILNRISIEVGFSRERESIYFSVEEPLGLESIVDIERWFHNQFKLLVQSIEYNNCKSENGLIREAIRYIRNEYMNDLALGDVAEHISISRIYLSQLFKQETGEKYIDFLNNVRIEKAKEYLKFYDMKTYEVAEKVGFQDSGYFARMFKKIVGKTPSEFKKEL